MSNGTDIGESDVNADAAPSAAFEADSRLVASFRLPVNVKGLIVLGDWLRRQYGEGLTMWQQGEFMFIMKPTEQTRPSLAKEVDQCRE